MLAENERTDGYLLYLPPQVIPRNFNVPQHTHRRGANAEIGLGTSVEKNLCVALGIFVS